MCTSSEDRNDDCAYRNGEAVLAFYLAGLVLCQWRMSRSKRMSWSKNRFQAHFKYNSTRTAADTALLSYFLKTSMNSIVSNSSSYE